MCRLRCSCWLLLPADRKKKPGPLRIPSPGIRCCARIGMRLRPCCRFWRVFLRGKSGFSPRCQTLAPTWFWRLRRLWRFRQTRFRLPPEGIGSFPAEKRCRQRRIRSFRARDLDGNLAAIESIWWEAKSHAVQALAAQAPHPRACAALLSELSSSHTTTKILTDVLSGLMQRCGSHFSSQALRTVGRLPLPWWK